MAPLRIAVLTLTPLAHDSRVLRHAGSLSGVGFDVRLFGCPPGPAADQPVTLLSGGGGPWATRLGLLARHAPAQILPASAPLLYWASALRRDLLSKARAFKPELIIANDWATLPVAAVLKAETGAKIIYDSHEFATTEFADRALWRWLASRHVSEVERRAIASADAVMTVSPLIAAELARAYALPTVPTVIRNLPDAAPLAPRPTGPQVNVLFHGLLRPHRGLEPLIDSVAQWRPGLSLTLRGYGAETYVAALRTRAAGAGGRIRFEPAVAPGEVVAAAGRSDIGFFALPDSSPQSRFALPNKVFEYIAAALAIVVTPLPEMKALLDDWGCAAYTGGGAGEIAAVLNALTAADIDALKHASARAAQTLNWRSESQWLLSLVAAVAQ